MSPEDAAALVQQIDAKMVGEWSWCPACGHSGPASTLGDHNRDCMMPDLILYARMTDGELAADDEHAARMCRVRDVLDAAIKWKAVGARSLLVESINALTPTDRQWLLRESELRP